MKRVCIYILLFCSVSPVVGQAGTSIFEFLSLPTGARLAGFGGYNVSLYDDDLNFAFSNPALLSSKSHNFLGLNYSNLFNDVNLGSAIYSRSLSEKDNIAFGINYVDYGTFLETSVTDEILGTFTAKDMALSIIYSRWLSPRWSTGVTLKPIYSVYERYQSFGLAFDMGISYHNEEALFSAGFVARNIGYQFSGYYSIDGEQHRESFPVDLQLGLSQKLPKAPIRFSLTFHNMQKWNLNASLSDSAYDPMDGKSDWQSGVDMFFRHTVWSVEILPTKNLYFVASYNHRTNMEMAVKNSRSLAGWSFGGGLKVYKFNVGFSVVPYQSGSMAYNATFSTNLSSFGVK